VKGRNNKGLITYDRKLKKDAYYLYKAYWNPEPMVYIAGRRFADRAPEERNVTVYTNCESVTLLVNGAEFETRAAEHHAVVFENVPLELGENTLTAVCGELEDTMLVNGVEVHNEAYTLPDIAAAMAVGNWFDDIKDDDDSDVIDQPEGFFSIEDSLNELMANPECLKIMKGWLVQQGSLSMASTLEAIRDMMGTYTFHSMSMYLDTVTQKGWAQVNRMLNKVKKD